MPPRLPAHVARAIHRGLPLGLSCAPDGTVLSWERPSGGASDGVYPPPGYHPWSLLQVGNGDTYGYYWPIGRERHDPIVCTTAHDAAQLLPITSTIEACVRLVRALAWTNSAELDEIARSLLPAPDSSPPTKSPGTDRAITHSRADAALNLERDPDAALALDPHSPHVLLLAGRKSWRDGDLAAARHRWSAALDLLPEFADASWALSQLARRERDLPAAVDWALLAAGSPLCFGGHHLHTDALQWLKRLDDAAHPDCSDPFWRRRRLFSLQTGVKHSPDVALYEEVLADYRSRDDGIRAVRVRLLLGEIMTRETTSFRDRHGWTPESHRSLLAADLRAAGLHDRLPTLQLPRTA